MLLQTAGTCPSKTLTCSPLDYQAPPDYSLKIGTGNSKTGPAWYIPAGTTCPDKTDACVASCYVSFGRMNLPANVAGRDRQLTAVLHHLKSGTFVSTMTANIRKMKLKTLRIHDSGDFFSPQYTRAWTDVIQANPDVTFWAYTRSFKTLLPSLLPIAKLPNMSLWLSADIDNWVEALIVWRSNPGVFAGIAFMQNTEESGDIAATIQKTVGKKHFVNFPVHKAFGRMAVEADTTLRNCPAITHAIESTKNNPACLQCRWCL